MKHILSAMAVLALAPTPAPAAQWTIATVEADRPFGKLDTSRAGRDFKGFWRGLSRRRGRRSVGAAASSEILPATRMMRVRCAAS